MNTYIGIDISKDSLSVAYPKLVSGFEMKTFTNDELGIEQLISSLPADARYVVEATGVYSRLLSYRLHESGQFVSVINPKQSAAFAKIQQSIVKNDNKDAQLLSLYGKHMNPPEWIPQSENVLKIKQKRVIIDQFTKQKVALNNVLLGIFRDVVQDKSSVNSLNDSIVFLQEQIKILEDEICQISEDDRSGEPFQKILRFDSNRQRNRTQNCLFDCLFDWRFYPF